MNRGLSRTQWQVLAAGVLATAAGIVGTRVVETPAKVRLFDNMHWTAAYLSAAVVSYLGIRRAEGPLRSARRRFAFGLTSLAVGQILWDLQVAIGWNPFPGPSDLFFLSLGPWLASGLLIHFEGLPSTEKRSAALDVFGVFVVALTLTLALCRPHSDAADLLTTTVLVLYAVLLMTTVGIVVVLVVARHWAIRPGLLVFLASTVGHSLLSVVWNVDTFDGTLRDGDLVNYLFSVATLALGVAAAVWHPEPARNALAIGVYATAGRLIPFCFVLAAASAVTLARTTLPSTVHGIVTTGVAILVVIAMLRQSLVVVDKERLLEVERRAAETDRKNKELEAQLFRSQRLEALGTLAGGVAHDFNNVLTGIHGHAELMLATLPPGSEERESAEDIVRGCQRASDLVRRIMSFSRRQEAVQRATDPNELVREALRLIRPGTPRNVELAFEEVPGIGHVEVDPGAIHQVLMNLVTNGAHAIGERSGRVEIELDRLEITKDSRFGIAPGSYVRISIRDNGSGMEPGVASRVFEPFFTTKGPGQGTGLGLSVVHGIVLSHGGAIEVDSTPGRGSEFRVILPVSERARGVPSAS
jgi:signal transduction histidine kinase